MPAAASRDVLHFHGDRTVSIETEPLAAPGEDEVQVETRVSAVSSGTERLVYEGNLPEELAADATIDALGAGGGDDGPYPMPYGYAAAGTVTDCGAAVDPDWLGQRVFAFQPHATHFNASVSGVSRLPDAVSFQQAVLYPNAETAAGLVMDGRPMIGERVAVFGLGAVGLLTVDLLAAHPVSRLLAIDPIPERREAARELGATDALPPDDLSALRRIVNRSSDTDPTKQPEGGADLVYELSGRPETLNDALDICGYGGRIIVGSWYGTKQAPVNLGGRFHRSHATVRASQVSTIGPEHRPRWTHERRSDLVWDRLSINTGTQMPACKFPFTHARTTYQKLATGELTAALVLHMYSTD